jgi:uncharacterized membrane protein HdeD (DUF308 family)
LSSTEPQARIPARKRWGLVAGFVAIAAVMPFITHGSEAGNAGWAWAAFFGLVALIAAFKPDIFL